MNNDHDDDNDTRCNCYHLHSWSGDDASSSMLDSLIQRRPFTLIFAFIMHWPSSRKTTKDVHS